jgi:hypothetical protein
MKIINHCIKLCLLLIVFITGVFKEVHGQNTYATATNLGTLTCAGPSYTNIASGTTVGAGNECGNASADRWYRFTITSAADVNISLCNSAYDTFLRLYNSGAANCAAASVLAVNDDATGCGTRSSITQNNLAAGTYVIMIEGWSSTEGNYQLDINVSNCAVPMTFSSIAVTQASTANVPAASNNQEVLRVEVVTAGSLSPLSLTSLNLNLAGTSLISDVTGVKVYYTGNSNIFNTTTLFGTTAIPATTATWTNVTGSQNLVSGSNYFWIAYDVSSSAIIGNVIDGRCRQAVVGGIDRLSNTAQNPAGSRTIVAMLPSPGGVNITNVKSWFKVDNYTSGSTTWNNAVPNANVPSLNAVVAPAYANTSPIWNYNPLLTFNGSITTDNFQVSFPAVTDILSVNEGSIIVVGTYPGSGGLGACGYFGSPGANNDEFSSQCIGTWYRGSNVTGTWTAATTPMNNTPSIHTSKFIRSGSTTNISTFYNSYSNGTNTNSTGFSTIGPHEYGVGVIPYAHDFGGSITEAITTSNNLTLSERTRIESYLAIKYGVTLRNTGGGAQGDYLATNGTLIWDASVNPSYHNDVIGIGRDDAQGLNQKQSHTLDDTTRVYINTLQTTNVANIGSFGNNVSYIVVGNNKGVMHQTTTSSAEVPGTCGLYTRLAREWKVTKTNFTNNFNFDIKLNAGANPTSVTVSDLRLLVDDDGNFANGGTTCYYNGDGTGIVISYANPVITVSGISNTHIANNSTKYITIGSIDAATPLPVDLQSYTASCKNNLPLLEWTTTTEINNDYFTIEKSTDGIYFDEVTIINGNGNSSLPINYSWLDEKPTNQTAYYRLKQTDFNGAFQYYGIEAIACKQEGSISIYPNPFDDGFTVNLDKNTTYPLTLEIYDYLGRKVFEQQIITNNTNIILGEKVTKGTYSVKIFNNTSQVVGRIIKTK